MTALQIYNLYRALYSYKPLVTNWNNHSIKLIDIKLEETSSKDTIIAPGTIEYVKRTKQLRVYCSDGRCVIVNKLGIEGKRIMTAMEFTNGYIKKLPASNKPMFV